MLGIDDNINPNTRLSGESNSAHESRIAAQRFITPEGLEAALRGAKALGQPLLLTGEPGTGKTTVADWANWLLRQSDPTYHDEPLRFITKTTSYATDLFYTYDALAHFQAVNLKLEERSTADFIELQALGKAIALSNPKQDYLKKCQIRLRDEDEQPLVMIPEKGQNFVVLIDEVDKAPRDFTNNILDEILNFRFRIREQGNYQIQKAKTQEIVIVLTSNSEKGLPEAFLRRCAFFHIDFPKRAELEKIVAVHFGRPPAAAKEALDFFEEVREKNLRKKPATAELLGWLQILEMSSFSGNWKNPENKKRLLENLAFLVKTQEDLEVVKKILQL